MADVETRLRELLATIATDHGYDDYEIDLKPISSGGANYTSTLYTVRLSTPGRDDLRLFSKAATLGEKVRSITDMQLFEIETIFYTEIVSKFRDLENKNNISEEDRLVLPKYYGGSTEYLGELMVLEDFTAKGFQSFDRFKCFDWEYASTCVGALAKLQALSVAFEKYDPKEYTDIIDKLKMKTSPDVLIDFINRNIAPAVEATDEIYRARVETFLRNEMKKQSFLKFFYPERRVLLSHGDFRPSNILHKVNEDGHMQVALVDYQLIKQGNPVTDLVYFLISGSDEEFRAEHLHSFFNHYYDTFSQHLQRLGIEPDEVYKEEDFRNDVKEILPYGLILATIILPIVTIEEDRAPKPEDGVDFDKFQLKFSDMFQVRFNSLVRDYVNLGIL